MDNGTYRFISGDIFDVLAKNTFQVDVVMCLGFLYHTLRYNELMSHIRRLNPKHVIVDTAVIARGKGAIVQLRGENATSEQNAVPDRYSYGEKVLIGKPNVAGLRVMFEAYGFSIARFSDWGSLLRDNPGTRATGIYARGRRVTMRCDAD